MSVSSLNDVGELAPKGMLAVEVNGADGNIEGGIVAREGSYKDRGWRSAGQGDSLDVLAAVKDELAYFCQALWQLDGFQARAISECSVAYGLDSFGNGDCGEALAVIECAFANRIDADGQGDGSQQGVVGKAPFTDRCHLVRQRNGGQTGAGSERTVAEGRDILGYGNLGH